MKTSVMLCLALVLCAAVMFHQAEGHGLRLKKLIKYGLLANAFTGKKILFPLPLPLPIPVFQENIHHQPIPINHHTHADIGIGFEQGGHYGGAGFGGAGYGGGFGGGYGGGLGFGVHGGGY